MSRQIFFIIWLAACTFTPSVWGSPEPNDTNNLQTLEDYLQYASLNSAELKAAFEDWKAALEEIPQAKALPDPKFTYSYFIKEIETRVGPQRQKFGIMQAFPWFGTIEAREDVATAKAKAAGQRYNSAKLKLFRQVKENFYEYAYLATAIEVAGENLELLRHFEEVARTKYKIAAAKHPDIVRAQIELAKLEDILVSIEKLREPIAARLNAVLNRPTDAQLLWPQSDSFEEHKLDREIIVDRLLKENPELTELNWEVEAANSQVELAKKKFYPEIGVGLDWIQTDEAMSHSVRDSGKDPLILMFSVNLPLWRDSYKAAEMQAKANVRSVQQRKVDFENKKIAEAIGLLYDIEDNQRKIKLYGDVLLLKAEELVAVSESAYTAGTIDFLSLIDAQRMFLKYKLDYERARTNYQQKIAELEMLVGSEL